MPKCFFTFFAFIIFFTKAQDFKDSENEVLVLLDSWANSNAFSSLFYPLKERGFNIKYKLSSDPTLSIIRYGDYSYKNIFILAPSVRLFGGKLDVKSLVKFVEDGGNLFISADSNIGEAIQELAGEFGVEFDAKNTAVIDHFNADISDEGYNTKLAISQTKNVIQSEVMVGIKSNQPILYDGIGLAINPANPLLTEILWAPESAYSQNPLKPLSKNSNTIGEGTKLIVALQTRQKNSRVIMCGSLKFLSDQFIYSPVENKYTGEKSAISGNGEMVQNLVKWLVHEQGVLRVKEIKHHRIGELNPPWEYTIKDKVHFSVDIEYKNRDGEWVPYAANDLQLSLIRIDPFIRVNLPHTGNHYSIDLILPDIYGVFKFVIDYRHTGYSYLYTVNEISVRPFKHTEYERFIFAAYPYYASAFSMIIGVFLFSFVFLYYKDKSVSLKKMN